jgi:CRISPR system Cascade subunit CasC
VHVIVFFPAGCPNRGRDGEIKVVKVGNVWRIRISSACLKRVWRTCDLFLNEFGPALGEGHLGLRTREPALDIQKRLVAGGLAEDKAEQWTLLLVTVFGVTKPKKKNTMDHLTNETMYFRSPEEEINLHAYIEKIIAEKLSPPNVKGEELEREAEKIRPLILQKTSSAVDIAMFGRFFAPDKEYSSDGCVQVAHAFTVHEACIEKDSVGVLDDIKERGGAYDNRGGGGIFEQDLASGTFVYHVTINRTALLKQLKDEDLVRRACRCLVEAIMKVFPKAKANSSGMPTCALYGRVERGTALPRNLSLAFSDPITQKGVDAPAIARLRETAANIDKVYGPCCSEMKEFNLLTGEGTLAELLELAGR